MTVRSASLLAGALCLGLAAANVVRAAVVPAVLLLVLALLLRAPHVAAACVLAVVGWWWGSERLHALERSALLPRVGTAARAVVEVEEPPRAGRFAVRVRVRVMRWGGRRLHEPVLLELPAGRAPPQGARLSVLGVLRAPRGPTNGFDERAWLHRHGVHVVLRVDTWRRIGRRGGLGGVADRLHAWLARDGAPGLAGERRGVVEGVVLGEDQGLSDTLKQRFRASGLYHLLAVSGSNVALVAAGILGLAWLAGVSRPAAEIAALAGIGAYVLAVGLQPSVIRAGVAAALGSLAWLTGRERDRWHALLVAAAVLLAWNPANAAAAPAVAPMLGLALVSALVAPVALPPAALLAQVEGWCAAYLAGCARFFGGLPGAQVRSPEVAAALAACVLLAGAYAWRRGDGAEARVPPDGQRSPEDLSRAASPAGAHRR